MSDRDDVLQAINIKDNEVQRLRGNITDEQTRLVDAETDTERRVIEVIISKLNNQLALAEAELSALWRLLSLMPNDTKDDIIKPWRE